MEHHFKGRGYLHEPFRIFYLTKLPEHQVTLHYHDFDKIVILLRGNVHYLIEDREYEVNPLDIVLVRAGEIHRPVFKESAADSDAAYERVIIYLSKEFFQEYSQYNLADCFKNRKIVITHSIFANVKGIKGLSDDVCRHSKAGELLQKVRLVEFLVMLNDAVCHMDAPYAEPITKNKNISNILAYINEHLTEDISVDRIAGSIHLNRFYLMHRFKAETGYTVKEYVTNKRLYFANSLIGDGCSLTEACYKSGFMNYSSFYRAYVKKYGHCPKERKSVLFGDGVEVDE